MTRTALHVLRWPANWPRAPKHEDARFSGDITITRAAIALQWEIEHTKGYKPGTIVITCGNGTAYEPTARDLANGHPGYAAAVYFTTHAPLVLACDKWRSVAHNLWALAKHIEVMRSMERWGVGTGKIAWGGYGQLPPSDRADPNARPPTPTETHRRPWRIVLGFGLTSHPTNDDIRERHRNLVRTAHPDAGGSHDAMAEINNARDEALEERAERRGAR